MKSNDYLDKVCNFTDIRLFELLIVGKEKKSEKIRAKVGIGK